MKTCALGPALISLRYSIGYSYRVILPSKEILFRHRVFDDLPKLEYWN